MVAIIKSGQGQRSLDKDVNRVICVATLNVGTMGGRSNDIVKILLRTEAEISDMHKNQEGEINQLGKSRGEIRTSSFTGKRIILVIEV